MEGTHTVLRLYKPIHELCFISLYFPTRKSQGFSRAAREVQPLCGNQHEERGEDPGRTKQRRQYYNSADEVQSCEDTKGAVSQIHWLAIEHHQLLTDLLSLCSECADRLKMGNQDGKIQSEGEHGVSSSNFTLPQSVEYKKASRVRKLKKLGSKKMDSAEDFLQSKLKKKVQMGAASEFSLGKDPETPGSGSYVSVSSEPFLPMDEDFHIANDGWDFMEESRFECEIDCGALSEFDNQLRLDYEKPIGNVRGRIDSSGTKREETFGGNDDRLNPRSDNIARKDMERSLIEQPVSHSCLDVEGIYRKASGQEEISRLHKKKPSSPIDASSRSSNLRSWTRSPTSNSISGVFNVSYPPTNTLRIMSPVLSPLSSQLPSPQMNHRIVLVPEEDDDGNKRPSRDGQVNTEVIDNNGNRRTASRLDLNLGNQFNPNGATTSGKRLLFCFKLKKKLCEGACKIKLSSCPIFVTCSLIVKID